MTVSSLRFPGGPRRALFRFALATLAIGLVSGCGMIKVQEREKWRGEAERACLKSGLVKEGSFVRIAKAIDGPGICGADYPMKVAAFETTAPAQTLQAYAEDGLPQVQTRPASMVVAVIKPEATLSCPMVATSDVWLNDVVQPAAQGWFGQPVTEVRTAGSYACRPINHRSGNRLSEHAFGNAVDVTGFTLADGRVVKVVSGWKGASDEQGFLREVIDGACQLFTTVLGPGANALHHDHFHFDLARHDAKGTRRYCNPRVQVPPRPDPAQALPYPQNQLYAQGPAGRPAPAGFGEAQALAAAPGSAAPVSSSARMPTYPPLATARAAPPASRLRPPAFLPSAGATDVGPDEEAIDTPSRAAAGTPAPDFDPSDFDLTGRAKTRPPGARDQALPPTKPSPPASSARPRAPFRFAEDITHDE